MLFEPKVFDDKINRLAAWPIEGRGPDMLALLQDADCDAKRMFRDKWMTSRSSKESGCVACGEFVIGSERLGAQIVRRTIQPEICTTSMSIPRLQYCS